MYKIEGTLKSAWCYDSDQIKSEVLNCVGHHALEWQWEWHWQIGQTLHVLEVGLVVDVVHIVQVHVAEVDISQIGQCGQSVVRQSIDSRF